MSLKPCCRKVVDETIRTCRKGAATAREKLTEKLAFTQFHW
jgi:hypothetical protein